MDVKWEIHFGSFDSPDKFFTTIAWNTFLNSENNLGWKKLQEVQILLKAETTAKPETTSEPDLTAQCPALNISEDGAFTVSPGSCCSV